MDSSKIKEKVGVYSHKMKALHLHGPLNTRYLSNYGAIHAVFLDRLHTSVFGASYIGKQSRFKGKVISYFFLLSFFLLSFLFLSDLS